MGEHLRFVSPRERVVYLKSLPFMEQLSRADLTQVAENMRERHFGPGEHLLWAGKPIEQIYILVRGRVGLYRDDERVSEIEAPSSVGLMGFLARDGRVSEGAGAPGHIRAEERTLALALPTQALEHALETNFDLVNNALRWLTLRVVTGSAGLPRRDEDEEPPAGDCPDREFNLVDRLMWLREKPPFSDCNLEAVAELCRHQQQVEYEEGQVIWEEGDDSEFLLNIICGRVDCEVSDGRRSFAGVNDTIGLSESLARTERPFTAKVDRRVVALRMGIEPLLAVLEDQFQMAMDVMATLAGQAMQQRWKP